LGMMTRFFVNLSAAKQLSKKRLAIPVSGILGRDDPIFRRQADRDTVLGRGCTRIPKHSARRKAQTRRNKCAEPFGGFTGAAVKSVGKIEGRPQRLPFNPHQRSMAD